MQECEKIIAAVYIGGSSVQMLIGRVRAGESVETINEYTAFSRLSNELAHTHRFTESGMAQTLKALKEIHEIGLHEGVQEFRLAASSSLRLAENRNLFLLSCRKEFGVYPQMLGGKDESRLNFIGASETESAGRPVITAYIGYNNFHIAYGTKQKIENLLDLSLGIGCLNRIFELNKRKLGFFGQHSLHSSLAENLRETGYQIRAWSGQFKIKPVLFLTGPFPALFLSLKTGHAVLEEKQLDAVPQTLSEVSALLKTVAQTEPQKRNELPGVSGELGNTLLAGISIIRALLESCGLEEFRISPRGLCTGLLKVPADITASVGSVIPD